MRRRDIAREKQLRKIRAMAWPEYKRAAEDFEKICGQKQLDPAEIRSKSRARKLFMLRVVIARELRAMRYTIEQIAAAMCRDHTAIVYYLASEARREKKKRNCRDRQKGALA